MAAEQTAHVAASSEAHCAANGGVLCVNDVRTSHFPMHHKNTINLPLIAYCQLADYFS